MSQWNYLKVHHARAMVYSALRTMRKSQGGAFSQREVLEIVQDVMELPEGDIRIQNWDKEQCRLLLVRLLARGLIYDARLFEPSARSKDHVTKSQEIFV